MEDKLSPPRSDGTDINSNRSSDWELIGEDADKRDHSAVVSDLKNCSLADNNTGSGPAVGNSISCAVAQPNPTQAPRTKFTSVPDTEEPEDDSDSLGGFLSEDEEPGNISKGWVKMDHFTFVVSRELDFPVHVKIGSLEGKQKPVPFSTLLQNAELRHLGSNQSPISDLYVAVQLWADSKPLGVPMQTPYKTFKILRTWNEWLKMPWSVKDLPRSAQLAITIWDSSPLSPEAIDGRVPFGGTTVGLFDEKGLLKTGKQKCTVHRHKAADGLSETTTPSVLPPERRNTDPEPNLPPGVDPSSLELSFEEQELERLEPLFKQHENGEIPRVDWLDAMVFKHVEELKVKAEAAQRKRAQLLQASKNKHLEKENFVLHIEFPRFDHPIVYTEETYEEPSMLQDGQKLDSSGVATGPKPVPEVRLGPGIQGADDGDAHRVIKIYDPEVGLKGNPCEDKHRRLVRSHRTGIMDRDLKPNPKIRDELNMIMNYGPTHELTVEEKDLVWRFRHHLARDKRALTKFVKSVNWEDGSEARQAIEILPKWTDIDIDDALELLGPTFDNPTVRSYAVDRLRKADDEELVLYLLQLVQALKYEKIRDDPEPNGEGDQTTRATQDSSLASFLIMRATENFMLGNYFHWYLMVECGDQGTAAAQREHFARVEYHFMVELEARHSDFRKTLLRQGELVTILSRISKDIRFSRDARPMKIEKLKKFLADPKNEVLNIDPPLPLPLDPKVLITGCYPEDSNVFKSSLSPLHVNFKTADGRKYPILFKLGDDMRQDQLVIQIISLMDRLLLNENLDLKLTPYRILATSPNAGAAQFIPSMSLSAASTKYKGSILAYLRDNNPDDKEPLGVRKEAMDTYVKSCAGYCVITYLLGVGDRHLDNLLLAPDGHFFHIDFGFILGRDPKPFAPMMKLCKEMVEGMGGTSSTQYLEFKQYCFTAYTTLRKSANLILNLFSLMVDANIPDIRVEPDKAVLKVQERFHLEMSEEEAIRHFDQLIGDSVNAIFGVVIDRLHDFVQGWRA